MMNFKSKSIKKLVVLSLLLSQALVLSIVESWIPVPIPIYGIKLGLANIISILVIVFFGFKEALAVVILRNFITAMFGGGFIVFFFSAAGGILSTCIMSLLYFKLSRTFSIIGISIAGSVMHNMGQIIMAMLIMKTVSVAYYLPVLLASGMVMGLFVGLCSNYLMKAVRAAKIMEYME